MIKNSKNLIRSCQYLKLNIHPILFKSRHNFGQLPKPTRFSQQLGLQKQFEKLQVQCEKQEKSKSKMYQFILWALLCIIGCGVGSFVVMPSFRSKAGLFYELVILSVGNKNRCMHSLEKTLKYQQKFYQNRLFSDKLTIKLATKCLNLKQLDSQKYRQVMKKILLNNLRNRENPKNNYSIYHKYLISAYSTNPTELDQSQQMKKIVANLLEKGDLKTVYLVAFMNNKVVKLAQNDRQVCLKRVEEFRKQVQENQQKIKQVKESNGALLVQPYQFDCQMRRKWIRYIQKNI